MRIVRGRGAVLALAVSLGVAPARASPARPSPCPSEGAGFVAVPGSDTCLRLSGRVAAGASGGVANRRGPAGSAPEPSAVGRLSIDTRTPTAIGPVRAFIRMRAGQLDAQQR